ncbi:hypothetical protein NE237_029290 [Protea cynaroides]|uniref:RING-type domain-containing protein n=1 Tax=Protea cynaroides TaxID=273540 RepID=A0A9Q0JW45_9MAGN|nr:hypothetical protein NE237_029290 [Protea cynaroides]
MSSLPVYPPIASPHSSASSNTQNHNHSHAPVLPFILVPLLPIIYCSFWCTFHLGITYYRRRRQSISASQTSEALPVRVSVQPRQPQLVLWSNPKGHLNEDCPICLEEAEDETDADTEETISWLLVPECNHRFHEPCLNRWLKFKQTCPLCRVTTELEAYVV